MIKEYIIKQTLGKGSYGIVYKVQKKNTNEIYVIKEIPLKGLSEKEISEVRQEAKILSSINSDFVVKYYDSFEENNKINIVMEYCDEGDLNDFILKKKKENKLIEEDLIWNIFIKITLGLAYIHKMKILHRDLKTMNIFLKSGFQVKIGDLGVAKILLKNSFAKTLIGTPYYLSPEICQEKPYNNKSDVWALGCILYELCTFKHPFEAKNQGALILKIMNNKPQNIDNYFSKDLSDLIFLLLEKDSEKRPSCRDILNYDFLINKMKNLGISKYLKELDLGKSEIKNNKEKIEIKHDNNTINKVKIAKKIINIDNINKENNNNHKYFKYNFMKENNIKLINGINSNRNKNQEVNNVQRKKSNEIKINEIILRNNSNNFNNRPVSNRNSNNHLLFNNFFINDEKNKYNKKLSNVVISKKNNKIISPNKKEINSNKVGKINQFKIVLNIPDKPPKTSNNFYHRKIFLIKNNEKKIPEKNKKEKQAIIINNNIDIKKVIPKYKFPDNEIKIERNPLQIREFNENEVKSINQKEEKKQNFSEKKEFKRNKRDIIKYNKIYDKNKDNKYLINILNKNDNIDRNKNSSATKNDKEYLDINFEIINNKSSDELDFENKSKAKELKDSIDDIDLENQKNKSYLSSNNDSKNNLKIESDISGDYEDENVKEIKESKNQDIYNSNEIKLSNQKKEIKDEIKDLEDKK